MSRREVHETYIATRGRASGVAGKKGKQSLVGVAVEVREPKRVSYKLVPADAPLRLALITGAPQMGDGVR